MSFPWLMQRSLIPLPLWPAAALLLSACGSPDTTPAVPTSAPSPSVVAPPPIEVSPGFRNSGWGVVGAPGIPFTFRVPDVSSWKVSEQGPWLVLHHGASQSRLEARVWAARRGVHRDECERQLRLWRSLPDFTEERSVDRRKVQAPPGFETEIRVDVEPRAQGARGWVVAIGVDARRCFAAVFSTVAQGQGFEQALGERLGLVSQEVLPLADVRVIGDRFGAVPRR